MKTKLLFLSLFLLTASISRAQDTLMMVKNSEVLLVKITEIGIDEIKYTPWGMENAPTIVVDKSAVRKIMLSNGTVMNFRVDDLSVTSMSESALAKNQIIKFQFFSLLTNCFAMGYETTLKKGMSLEAKVGIIGLGIQGNMPDAAGAYIKIGPKFTTGKDYYVRGERRSHPLRGAYIKPELAYSHFWQDVDITSNGLNTTTTQVTYNSVAVNIIFGKQILLSDIMTLDWYFGLGYGYESDNFDDSNVSGLYYDEDPSFQGYVYSNVYFGKTFPMTMTGGLTLGVLFK